ncbi:MAG: tRNA threonylcarbamoyladenosine dehydratase [Candidatus Izimaplasma sp.]|nr:tRNA threonylcarbamoyladenosine dehydratase [Candidatus Izimaplasma bacterium]
MKMIFKKTIQLIGEEKFNLLQKSTVLVVGLGGVGGHATEALARSGIGKLIIVDQDVVDETNINRQVIALSSTVGLPKTVVMKERLLDINKDLEVLTYHTFYDFDSKHEIFNHKIDYVIDAIDTITFKIDIIKECLKRGIPFISSMGQGNKLHPEKLEISEITKTSYDPIARIIRNKLRKEGIKGKVPVIYSKEEPNSQDSAKRAPASSSFVPAVAGLLAASYIVNKIIE